MAVRRRSLRPATVAIVLAFTTVTAHLNGALSVNAVSAIPDSFTEQYGYSITIAPQSDAIVAGDYFRIYDFGGYVAGSISAPPGWLGSVSLTNPPPTGISLVYGDDPGLENLTFTYTGSSPILGGTSGQVIMGFDASSTVLLGAGPRNTVFKDFVGSITNELASNGVNGPTFVSEGAVSVPAPEPTSLGLLALGSPLLLIRRRAV